MNYSSSVILGEAEKKMSGYTVMMLYQLCQFCIQADPVALLSVSVEDSINLEEVAQVATPNDYQFAIIPKNPSFIFPICKAISIAHPEFKIEQKSEDDNDEDSSSSPEVKAEKPLIIYCTMPEVNKDRRDKGMDYVSVLYDKTMSNLDLIKGNYGKKIAEKLVGNPKELDEARNAIDNMYTLYKEMCDTQRKDKEEAIENAYQSYLAKEKEKEQQKNEEKAAKGENVGKSMNFGLSSFE